MKKLDIGKDVNCRSTYTSPSCEVSGCDLDMATCLSMSLLEWGADGDAGSAFDDLEDITL